MASVCCRLACWIGESEAQILSVARRQAEARMRPGPASEYASCNRTCEIGMSAATGRSYRHILEVLAEVAKERGRGDLGAESADRL